MENTQTKKWEPINFVFYLSFVKWPVLFGIIVEIAFRLFVSNFFEDWHIGRIDLIAWIIRLVIFVYLGVKVVRHYGEVLPMGFLSGGTAGLLLGSVGALFRFYQGFKIWKVFNAVSEPILTILIGCLAGFLVIYVWDLLPLEPLSKIFNKKNK